MCMSMLKVELSFHYETHRICTNLTDTDGHHIGLYM